MVFSSHVFLYVFLLAFLAVYAITPRGLRSTTISLASLLFYGWSRPDLVLLMLFSTVLDYVSGLRIAHAQSRGRTGHAWLILSMVGNLGMLATFKYAHFLAQSLRPLVHHWGWTLPEWEPIALPVGISFYTFQTMSYTIDVFRRDVEAQRNPIDFLCFVTMFPQLVAGPIVRYHTIAHEIRSRQHSLSLFFRGVLAFQSGFAKKILIADPLSTLADTAFAATSLAPGDAWLGILAYAFQIYFDFSGYSDMAIGLGLMLGFHFPINFDRPYWARSITDFWRRWHISLSTWLRDYLYVPLGGNRKGSLRTYVNLALVMLLGGLWHGANWTFVVWGAYQGFWLIVERLLAGPIARWRFPRALGIAWTFFLVLIGWVFFRAKDLPHAIDYLSAMFGLSDSIGQTLGPRPIHFTALGVASLIVWFGKPTRDLVDQARLQWVLPLQAAFWWALLHMDYEGHVPFLYFQF